MTSTKKTPVPRLLPVAATILTIAGALISLGLMLYTGRRNSSILLIALFVIWVLSPFVALLAARVISKRWLLPARKMLYAVMIIITLGSMVGYSGILSPRDAKPAAIFLIVPLLSWIIIVIAIAINFSRSGKSSPDE